MTARLPVTARARSLAAPLVRDKSGGIVGLLPRPVAGRRLIPKPCLHGLIRARPRLDLAPRQIGPQRRRQPLFAHPAGLGRGVAGRGAAVREPGRCRSGAWSWQRRGHGSGDSEPGGPGARPTPKAAPGEPSRPARARILQAISRWATRGRTSGRTILARRHPLWQFPPASGAPLRTAPDSCCRSSVVEHPLGKGEVVSSILPGSTRKSTVFSKPARIEREAAIRDRPIDNSDAAPGFRWRSPGLRKLLAAAGCPSPATGPRRE